MRIDSQRGSSSRTLIYLPRWFRWKHTNIQKYLIFGNRSEVKSCQIGWLTPNRWFIYNRSDVSDVILYYSYETSIEWKIFWVAGCEAMGFDGTHYPMMRVVNRVCILYTNRNYVQPRVTVSTSPDEQLRHRWSKAVWPSGLRRLTPVNYFGASLATDINSLHRIARR